MENNGKERQVVSVEERRRREEDIRKRRLEQQQHMGIALLYAKLLRGGDPTKADLCAALMDAGAQLDRADALFGAANESFEALTRAVLAAVDYATALYRWRELSWWRRRKVPAPAPPDLATIIEPSRLQVAPRRSSPAAPPGAAGAAKAGDSDAG